MDYTTSGDITAIQATANTPVAGATVVANIANDSNVSVLLYGAAHAGYNVTFEVSFDNGVTWPSVIQGVRIDTGAIGTSTGVITTNSALVYNFYVGTVTNFRVRATARTSGTLSVVINGTDDPAVPIIAQSTSGSVAVSNFTSSAALADATANPTTGGTAAFQELYNGTTWDRQRNNALLTPNTSSAKTATGTGATETNYNARGAIFYVNVTAVSGTTPTMTVKLQESYDGTNFRDVDTTNLQTASITAAGQFKLAIYPGITTAANASLNSVLPRTHRLAWTIGGTTPSFTFATYTHYIV